MFSKPTPPPLPPRPTGNKVVRSASVISSTDQKNLNNAEQTLKEAEAAYEKEPDARTKLNLTKKKEHYALLRRASGSSVPSVPDDKLQENDQASASKKL